MHKIQKHTSGYHTLTGHIYVQFVNRQFPLTLRGPGGGGGVESTPLNVSRDNFAGIFLHVFALFFFRVLHNF